VSRFISVIFIAWPADCTASRSPSRGRRTGPPAFCISSGQEADMPGSLWTAVVGAVLLLTAYSAGGGLLPYLLARSTIRIHRRRGAVRLTAIDAAAMFAGGFVLWPLVPLFLMWGIPAAVVGGGLVLMAWLGFRLNIQVTRERTWVVRKLVWIIPWSRRSYPAPVRAFTDGWGDFADPEALNLELPGRRPLELAWGDAHSGRHCDDLAAAFNAAVAELGT
jgi:hypothetical protein